MKPRQFLIYLIVFAVLGLFYYIYEVRLVSQTSPQKEEKARIYDLDFDRITEVKYKRGNNEYHLVKEGADQWRLLAPIKTAADKWQVEMMLRRVLSAEKEKVFTGSQLNLAEFGLAEPEIAVSLMAGQRLLAPSLYLGAKTPVGYFYYARLGDLSSVFTVSASVYNELAKELFDLRDKSLVIFPGEKIDGLILSAKDKEPVELEKKGLRRWSLLKPAAISADSDLIQKIVFQGLKGRAKAIKDPDDKQDYGFNDPTLTIKVQSQGQVVAELIIGKVKEDQSDKQPGQPGQKVYWARGTERTEVIEVPANIVEMLRQGPEELKDRHVLDLDRRRLNKVHISHGANTLTAVKQNEAWEVTPKGKGEDKDLEVEAFLMALEELKYVKAFDEAAETVAKFGLAKPDLTVELTGPDDKQTWLYVNLTPIEGHLIAVRSTTGPVVLIDQGHLIKKLPTQVRPASAPQKAGDQNVVKEGEVK